MIFSHLQSPLCHLTIETLGVLLERWDSNPRLSFDAGLTVLWPTTGLHSRAKHRELQTIAVFFATLVKLTVLLPVFCNPRLPVREWVPASPRSSDRIIFHPVSSNLHSVFKERSGCWCATKTFERSRFYLRGRSFNFPVCWFWLETSFRWPRPRISAIFRIARFQAPILEWLLPQAIEHFCSSRNHNWCMPSFNSFFSFLCQRA